MVHAKVLVVDHEQGAYDVLKLGLAKRGYEMHTTTTMANALALAGAHVYQAAFVSLTLVPDRTVLDGLHAEIPDLPVILIHSPEHAHHIPQQMLEVAANAIGKPLALGPMCLMLDRTMELVSLRAQVRQHRQLWCLTRESASEADAASDTWRGHAGASRRGPGTSLACAHAQPGTFGSGLAAPGSLIVCGKAVADRRLT